MCVFPESSRGVSRGDHSRLSIECARGSHACVFQKSPLLSILKITDFTIKEISNFSSNVYFQKDSNMSALVFLTLLLLEYTNACLDGHCRCYEKLEFIDCSHRDLHPIPHANSTMENYRSILLRGNKLRHLNFTSLLESDFKTCRKTYLFNKFYN